mgnify:CR=1 FL=1
MSRALTPGDLERLPTWLLEVTYTGRVFRWCSAADGLDLTLSDGTIATYAPGLDPVALVQAASGPSADPDELSIPVEVFFPVDVAELEAEGHALDAASAEVSLLPHGATRNRRRIVLDGQVITPVYGDADEPVAFSIEAQPWDDGAMIPPSTHVVTASTWPQATGFELPDDSIGAIYPGVIGTPGWLNRSPSATTSGSPGIVVKFETATSFAHRLLIAGHRVGASSVVVFYDGGHITGTVAHEQDTLGQECATIDISGEAAAVKESGWYWIGWNSADGGRQLDSGSGVLELAGGAGMAQSLQAGRIYRGVCDAVAVVGREYPSPAAGLRPQRIGGPIPGSLALRCGGRRCVGHLDRGDRDRSLRARRGRIVG